MAYGKGDRLQETHDGNLSSVLSQVRDYGPAVLGPAAARPAWMPDKDSAFGVGAGDVPQLLREAEPPESPKAEIPAPQGRSGPETMPNLPHDPAARAIWRPTSYITVAVLTATLVTGGVIAALYRAPIETALRRETAPNGDPALREEIAALQTSISMLAERVETIAAADKVPRQESVLGEPLDPTIGQTADPGRQGRGAEGLEVRLDTLGHRLDSMAEKVVRLTSETERSLAQALAAPASPGPQRIAPRLAKSNAAASRTVAPDAVLANGAASGNPHAASGPVSDGKAAAVPIAPERAAAPGSGRSYPLPLAGAPAPAIAEGPPTQPATPSPAPDLSPKVWMPIAGPAGALAISEVQAKPVNPGPQVAAAESVGASGARSGLQVTEPLDDATAHSPAPTSPLPEAGQKKLKRLAAILGEEIAIRADAVTDPRAREGHIVADPEATGALDQLVASKKGFAKLEVPTVPGVSGAAAGAPPESVVPEASGPEAPPAAAEEEWFINLAAVRSKSTALELQRTYRDKGVDTQVASLGRNGLFGVRVGGFSSRGDAIDRAPAIKTALGIRDVWIARR